MLRAWPDNSPASTAAYGMLSAIAQMFSREQPQMGVVRDSLRGRGARLSPFGMIAASVGMTLVFGLRARTRSDCLPVNAQERGVHLLCQSAPPPARPVEFALHWDDGDREAPERSADVADQSDVGIRPRADLDSAPVRLKDLAARFREHCAACHGDDGTGNIARQERPSIPDFTDLDWQLSQTEAAIVNQITDGSAPRMPSFRHDMSPRQIFELAVYLRTLTGRPPTAPDADGGTGDERSHELTAEIAARIRAGAGIFRQRCVGCHGTDGRGRLRDQPSPIPDFTLPAWQDHRSDPQLVSSIMDGKGTLMPANRGRLTEPQARDLVAYVRSLGAQPREQRTRDSRLPIRPSQFEKSFRELERRLDELKEREATRGPRPGERNSERKRSIIFSDLLRARDFQPTPGILRLNFFGNSVIVSSIYSFDRQRAGSIRDGGKLQRWREK